MYSRFTDLPCLLARAWTDGRFELLSPAWEALGYGRTELSGCALCELVALGPDAAREALKGLFTEGGSLELGLHRKYGGDARYYWNRQFDDYSSSIFIIGDELPAGPRAARAPHRWRQPVLDTA